MAAAISANSGAKSERKYQSGAYEISENHAAAWQPAKQQSIINGVCSERNGGEALAAAGGNMLLTWRRKRRQRSGGIVSMRSVAASAAAK